MSANTPSTSDSTAKRHWKVQLYLYDLSQGMARALSPSFLGRQIDGIWHSGVVVYGWEYFYGGGIQAKQPGQAVPFRPVEIIDMGYTDKTQEQFHEYLRSVSHRYRMETYSLLSHNCNNFADDICKFLNHRPIPSHITGLPEEALNTPMGQMLRPMITQMEQSMKNSGSQLGAGMVPWGSDTLDLPRINPNLQPDAMLVPAALAAPTSTSISTSHTTTTTSPAMNATVTQLNGHTTLTTVDNITHEVNTSTIDHPHSTLKFRQLQTSNVQPMTSSDNKGNTFVALIKANNGKAPKEYQLTDSERQLLTKSVTQVDPAVLPLFDRMIEYWPTNSLFPVYGLLRILMLQSPVLQYYEKKGVQYVIDTMLSKLDDSTLPMAARVMLLCTVANMFHKNSQLGEELADHESVRHRAAETLSNAKEQAVQVMAATLLYNIAISLPKSDVDSVVETVSLLSHQATQQTDNEVVYRLLLALSQLIFANSSAALLFTSLEFDSDTVRKRFGEATSNETTKKIIQLVDDLQTIADYEMKQQS